METFSFIALILLSLVGYSVGAVGKAGKFVELKPQIIDLILVVLIWAGVIYSRINLNLNKWILIIIWIILGIITGMLAMLPRNLSEAKLPNNRVLKRASKNLHVKLLQNCKNFSNRIGSFQSRIIISLFFFTFVSPFALALKIFSDPLKIKHQRRESHWLPKKEINADLDQFRRQF